MTFKKVNTCIILEGSDLRFLRIYEKNVQSNLVKPNLRFAHLCLDNVKMY